MNYADIVADWQTKNIKTVADLSRELASFGPQFIYHLCKLSNGGITYGYVSEIFKKSSVTNYTGDIETLLAIKNAKNAYEAMLDAFDLRKPVTVMFIQDIQQLLTSGLYDRQCYKNGDRPGWYREEVSPFTGEYLGDYYAVEMVDVTDSLFVCPSDNLLIGAAQFLANLEDLLPFTIGNVGTGIIVVNYYLFLHNHPPVIIHEEDRDQYFTAMYHYIKNNNISTLVEFLYRQVCKTWDKITAL